MITHYRCYRIAFCFVEHELHSDGVNIIAALDTLYFQLQNSIFSHCYHQCLDEIWPSMQKNLLTTYLKAIFPIYLYINY